MFVEVSAVELPTGASLPAANSDVTADSATAAVDGRSMSCYLLC